MNGQILPSNAEKALFSPFKKCFSTLNGGAM